MIMAGRLLRWSAGDRTIVFTAVAVILITAGLGAWMQRGGSLPSQSFCVSVLVFGQECPGCGLTRSFVAMGSGDFAGGILLNPLGPVLIAGIFVLLVMRIVKLFIPPRDDWHRADLAIAGIMILAMLVRMVQFYLSTP